MLEAATNLMKYRSAFLWCLAAMVAFGVGRLVCHRAFDFPVYYQSAKSLVAGRVDLYAADFAVGPPMVYVYPPLFMLLIFPVGWLSLANAFGAWFALNVLATTAVVRLAYRQWTPHNRAQYAWLALALAGPFVVGELKSGNAQLLIVLLLIGAVVAWSKGKLLTASFCLALGGAIKIFPLFLLPVLIVRREWAFVTRTVALSCALWLIPAVYFGPRQTVSLYRAWANPLVFHLSRFESQRALDQSISGAATRWLTHLDYSARLDRNYPQVNRANLSRRAVKAVIYGVDGIILALSLWMCARLRRRERDLANGDYRRLGVACTAAIFMTFQLLLGPYTPVLYLCGWLLVAMVLPAVIEQKKFLYNVLLAAGTVNLLLILVPGRMHQRAFQAYGAFTFLGLILWEISMASAWILLRESRESSSSAMLRTHSNSEPELELAGVSTARGSSRRCLGL